jgi:hypothetical protein
MALASRELTDAATDTLLLVPDGSCVSMRVPLVSSTNRRNINALEAKRWFVEHEYMASNPYLSDDLIVGRGMRTRAQ